MPRNCLEHIILGFAFCLVVLTGQVKGVDSARPALLLTPAPNGSSNGNGQVDLLSTRIVFEAFAREISGQQSPIAINGSLDPDQPISGLLITDKNISVELPAGKSSVTVDLGGFFVLDRLTLEAIRGTGSFDIAISPILLLPDASAWQPLGESLSFTGRDFFSQTFAPTEARFVRIRFNNTTPTTIRGAGLFGDLSAEEFNDALPPHSEWPPITEDTQFLRVNFGSSYNGARVTHLNYLGSNDASHINDSLLETYFDVPPEASPFYFLIRLSDTFPVDQASMAMDPSMGTLAIYTFNALPEEIIVQDAVEGEDYGAVVISEDFSSRFSPSASVTLSELTDFAQLELDGLPIQYALVRWQTNPHHLRVRNFSLSGNFPMALYLSLPAVISPVQVPVTNPIGVPPTRLVPASE